MKRIERAEISCEEAEQAVSDQFHIDVKMITAGKGAKRKAEDIYLSRYAWYCKAGLQMLSGKASQIETG